MSGRSQVETIGQAIELPSRLLKLQVAPPAAPRSAAVPLKRLDWSDSRVAEETAIERCLATSAAVGAPAGPRALDRRLLERRPRFREVPGLLQKIYGRDGATGDVCGIYFFESNEALDAFRETELARTIPPVYEAIEVRREVYDVLYPL